ncbi:MAG: hypothetical protein JWP10_156 [Nocardioidaceae bacterium]|nr:hypothetical protein [Nocardioidaceae bacterium]
MSLVPSSAKLRAYVVVVAAAVLATLMIGGPAQAATPQAPGNFRGYGFDACVAPEQAAMDQWNLKSPFSAIGIYISGHSRYCGDAYQPNLSKEWVAKNAANGWRFIPIHVGYQAPCFPVNKKSRVIKKTMSTTIATARKQAVSDAKESVASAIKYGLGKGSTLYLDIEAYNRKNADCDNATMQFVDAWTEQLHAAGYLSGLYSSGSAAIVSIDKIRMANTPGFDLPDQIWNAWTNQEANTDGGPYLADDGWVQQRLHQYDNGLWITYGGYKLNIDKNFLDVGGKIRIPADAKPCKKADLTLASYPTLKLGAKGAAVSTLQCLLKQRGLKKTVSGGFGVGTQKAVNTYRASKGWSTSGVAGRGTWTALLSEGSKPRVLKYGSVGEPVFRLQRALSAATGKALKPTGFYNQKTVAAVKAYRKTNKISTYGTTEATVWALLAAGNKG